MDPERGSHQRLISGQDTWSARCPERGTPGAGGGPGKRAGGDTGTAPVGLPHRCAAYLAAILEFCGGGILTTSLEPIAGDPVRLVDAADVIRPEAGAVAEEALSWLTATPLLRSLSDNQWQFASQALQGFLAATHLKGRRLAPVTVQSLLFAGVGQERYVHPRHKDLAGWLAWYRPEVYKEILALDPVPLLSPDLPAQPPACARRSLMRCSPMRRA